MKDAYFSSYDHTINIALDPANDLERDTITDFVTLIIEKAVQELNSNIDADEEVLTLVELAASIRKGLHKYDDWAIKEAAKAAQEGADHE